MRNEKICVFAAEEDCPKEKIGLTCENCIKHKHYEVIENAVQDFVSLGESFTDLFLLCNKLFAENGKTVSLDVPVESLHKINRVMTALLTVKEDQTEYEVIYRRLIFYFFSIIVDEFIENEYTEDTLLN